MQASTLAASAQSAPARTALYGLHRELGAKLVCFAGYSMPLNYPAGILAEHRHTRAQASLFDVSHMSRFRIQGDAAASALESLCPADLVNLAPGQLRYSVMTNESGGCIDDVIIRRAGNDFEIIANAANRDNDHAWLCDRIGQRCQVRLDEYFSLLALQGPAAAAVMRELNPDSDKLGFMQTGQLPLAGIDCRVGRAGYTGEDGFEISVPIDATTKLAQRLLAHEQVQPAGLGARDGLRLEAGLSLYGHELDATTSPVEAGLGWAIAKARRLSGARAGGFPGHERILAELKSGPSRRLTGLLPDTRSPLRSGTLLIDSNGTTIGTVTSGGHSPILKRPVAIGYIDSGALNTEIPVYADNRGKRIHVELTRLPFIPHKYIRR
ncbi:MAG: glycine cleavage system aminomethyltransferase GcvT [Gammaproteobacteria bacterium]